MENIPPRLQKDPHNTLWGTLGTKSTPKWPQRACHEAPCAPKGLPRTPKGAQRIPKDVHKVPKEIQNDPQGHQKALKIVPKTPKGDPAKNNK